VHFHTRVYIHTGQAEYRYCKWGSWGGGSKAPSEPLPTSYGVWGSAVSSPSGVRGGAPATNRFFAFWCAQNGSPTQHEAPEHAWGPPPGGTGVLPPALPTPNIKSPETRRPRGRIYDLDFYQRIYGIGRWRYSCEPGCARL